MRDLTEHAQLNCIDILRVNQSDGSTVETASITQAPNIKLCILATETPLTDTMANSEQEGVEVKIASLVQEAIE